MVLMEDALSLPLSHKYTLSLTQHHHYLNFYMLWPCPSLGETHPTTMHLFSFFFLASMQKVLIFEPAIRKHRLSPTMEYLGGKKRQVYSLNIPFLQNMGEKSISTHVIHFAAVNWSWRWTTKRRAEEKRAHQLCKSMNKPETTVTTRSTTKRVLQIHKTHICITKLLSSAEMRKVCRYTKKKK